MVVDDGVATGVTAVAALRWARAQGAATVIFAAPVGPAGIERRLAGECDRCVVSVTPGDLRAVGQWYERFDQTTDDEVRVALRQARVTTMDAIEIAAAVVFAALGVRSLVHWVRTPYESRRASDLVLYALFVTGRVGMWFVLATAFTLYALHRYPRPRVHRRRRASTSGSTSCSSRSARCSS